MVLMELELELASILNWGRMDCTIVRVSIMHILLVEDNHFYNHYVTTLLKDNNYVVYSAESALTALQYAKEFHIDIAIIDLYLPSMDGLQLVTQLRKLRLSFPIMMLTACDAWQDKVDGLEAGADDYLVKPFQKDELLARLHALLRRSTSTRAPKLIAGDYVLDLARKELSIAGEIIVLTSFEYLTLECLMRNSRQVISKQHLLSQLYSDRSDGDLNIVEVMVSRLRKKLIRHSITSPIVTIRYQGYVFTLPCYRT